MHKLKTQFSDSSLIIQSYKMKRFIIAYIVLGVLVANATYAQQPVITANQFETKADAAYEIKDYNTALSHYMTILNDEPDRADLYWKTAESARLTRRFGVAETYYEALSKNPELSKIQPLLDYHLAMVKKSLGKYDMAIALLQKYTTTAGDLATTATTEIEALKWAKEASQIRPYEPIHLNDNINTIYIDAAPVRHGDILYYTSASFKKPDGAPVTNVFSSNMIDKALPLAINSQTEGVHTAYYALNTEGSRLYYNLCDQEESGNFHCQIHVREKSADGSWGKPNLLDTNTINISGFTATQPNIGFDKTKGKDVLYFVSDRRGGRGGLDIWAADIEANGILTAPVNLTAVNTSKDDITPFFMNGPQILTFSTEGYETFGGFDIFTSELTRTGFAEVKNIGYPMNTSYDDMYTSFDADNAKYYFVSNRVGGLCDSDKKDCVCNDIYEHNIMVNLDASTFLAGGGTALIGCKIDLVDLETGKIVTKINEEGNGYNFPLLPNKRYQLIASKSGYMSDTITFNTIVAGAKMAIAGEASSDLAVSALGIYAPITKITKKLILNPKLRLDIYVFDKINRKVLNGATVEIRSENGKTLYATETLKGNFLTWGGIEFGKTYKLIASKATFEKDEKMRPIEGWSSTMTKFVYTDSLYLTPFSGLPLTLYFDNDYPDPRTRNMTTVYTYGETYVAYYAKQTEYLNAYYKDNNDVSASGANEISNFFKNDIKYGYDKLNEYSNKLLEYLNNGYGMEIVLEGYASPLAENEYNRILTSRRVSSVINQFDKYQNGIFRAYIQNGQLRIRVKPFGEEKADQNVSDDAKNRRKSVYSVPAMKERKVEIKEINVFQYNPKDGYSISDALGIYLDVKALSRPPYNTTLGDVDRANSYSVVSKNGYLSAKGVSSQTATATEMGTMGYAKDATSSTQSVGQKRYEVVFVDSYTGEIIKKGASAELFDQYADKMVGKAKKKGRKYYYNVDLSKDYLVKGSAAGYGESTVNKSSIHTEGGNSITTDTMFLLPFGGLPLPLYFDNDKPSGEATSESTSTNYTDTYRPFISRKQDFISAYNKIVAAQGGITSPTEMNSFFENEIKKGYEQLSGYTTIMKRYLQNGSQLEIVLEGYASPLANAEYNRTLSARRVNSVINYLSSVSGGSLKKYIKSGQLKISVLPQGEVNANVSDDENNASSIYSVEASRERKVVIKDIIILNNVHYKK